MFFRCTCEHVFMMKKWSATYTKKIHLSNLWLVFSRHSYDFLDFTRISFRMGTCDMYLLWNLTCEWVALRWYFWWSFVLVFHWVWRLANYGDTKEGTMLTLNPNVVRISVGIWLGLIPTFFWLLSKSMYLYRSWKLLKIICHHHSLCWCTCIHVMWFHEHPPERVFSL